MWYGEGVSGAGRRGRAGGGVGSAGREMLVVGISPAGGLVSPTVTAGSMTLTRMECGPTPRGVPAAGLWVMTSRLAGVQLSLATIWETTSGTVPWQLLSEETVMAPGGLRITGAVRAATLKTMVAAGTRVV